MVVVEQVGVVLQLVNDEKDCSLTWNFGKVFALDRFCIKKGPQLDLLTPL